MKDKIKTVTNLLHNIFCRVEHSDEITDLVKGRDDSKCYYYLEETLEDCWSLKDHGLWLEKTADFLKAISDEKNLVESVQLLVEMTLIYEKLVSHGEAMENFIFNLFYKEV